MKRIILSKIRKPGISKKRFRLETNLHRKQIKRKPIKIFKLIRKLFDSYKWNKKML